MNPKLILVPTDFSRVAQTALNHAIAIAKSTHGKINLLHLVPNQNMILEAKTKLQLAQSMAMEDYGFHVDVTARVGTIFEEISDLAAELSADLIVMGTHGMRGLQFIKGSNALRIVTSAKLPFIIVQEKEISENGYQNIVVPLDLHKETKQKLSLVADMAKYFDSKVHIIVPREKDEYLRNTVTRNLTFAETFFEGMGIAHSSKISENDSDDFDETIIAYAVEIGADLISIMNLPGVSLASLIGGSYAQNIITNKPNIPVLILNPKEVTNVSIFGAYTGAG